MTTHIIYNNFLTPDGNKMSIGGIQTYITNLIAVLQHLEHKIIIHQIANFDFHHTYNGYQVYGYNIPKNRKTNQNLILRAQKNINQGTDLVIFGCETCAVKHLKCRTIGIQHGIFWDKPEHIGCSGFKYNYIFLKKMIKAWLTIKRISNLSEIICVDYNFVNWYRSLVAYQQVKTTVIPNFCKVPISLPPKPNNSINIIFARRFFPYRGTRIMAEALTKILQEYPNVKLIIAGEGPDENYLRKKFHNTTTEFIKYQSEDSLIIHKDCHIALIPTLGSEGTSLSLLEAMASGCTTICTNVGGMTNIVLDHYNGIMITPDTESLYYAVKEVIDNEKLRMYLSQNAYVTAQKVFSLSRWQRAWEKVILNACKQYEK